MNKYLCLRFRKIVFIVLILVDNKFNHFLATNYSSPRLQDRQTARPQDRRTNIPLNFRHIHLILITLQKNYLLHIFSILLLNKDSFNEKMAC